MGFPDSSARNKLFLPCAATFQDADCLYFVLELAEGGDLFDIIERQGGSLPEPWARHYLGAVSLGIQHMHCQGFVYRDLKPENVLIDAKGFARGSQTWATQS